MSDCICPIDPTIPANPRCPTHGTGWTHIGGSMYMAPIGTPLPTHPGDLTRIRRQCGACDGTGTIPEEWAQANWTPDKTTRECPLCNGTGTQL